MIEMGSKLTHAGNDLRAEIASHHLAATVWIPREIRCRNCHELAHLDVTQRLSEDEIAVRYVCPDCRWCQTRHFHESHLDSD